jgi:hypothetical protein
MFFIGLVKVAHIKSFEFTIPEKIIAYDMLIARLEYAGSNKY